MDEKVAGLSKAGLKKITEEDADEDKGEIYSLHWTER